MFGKYLKASAALPICTNYMYSMCIHIYIYIYICIICAHI